jgi:hypothetical protein
MDRRATIQGIWEQETGTLQPLGQITGAGGSAITNATTAVPFTIPFGSRLVLQCTTSTAATAWIASPDVDTGAVLTPTTTGAYPQIQLNQMIATCLFGGGGQGTGVGQNVLSVISANLFVVNVFRLR